MPQFTFDILKNCRILSNDNMYMLLRHKIISLGTENLKEIYDVSEGLENKIFNSAIHSKSYEELINNIKSKRYTMSRIKRILVHILLNITNDCYTNLKDSFYARVLKANPKTKKQLLSIITKSSSIPILTNLQNQQIDKLPNNIKNCYNLDFTANNIYQILSNGDLYTDKTNMI